MANYDEIVALKEKIKADLGDVDILINNAALLPKVSLLQGNPEDIVRIIKVNLISYFWVSFDCQLLLHSPRFDGGEEEYCFRMRLILWGFFTDLQTIRVFLPGMITRGRGHIVGIASAMAYESTCRAIAYSTTKFGIRGLMDGIYDLARCDNLNINVTTVFPPLVNTRKEFVDHFIEHGGYVT